MIWILYALIFPGLIAITWLAFAEGKKNLTYLQGRGWGAHLQRWVQIDSAVPLDVLRLRSILTQVTIAKSEANGAPPTQSEHVSVRQVRNGWRCRLPGISSVIVTQKPVAAGYRVTVFVPPAWLHALPIVATAAVKPIPNLVFVLLLPLATYYDPSATGAFFQGVWASLANLPESTPITLTTSRQHGKLFSD